MGPLWFLMFMSSEAGTPGTGGTPADPPPADPPANPPADPAPTPATDDKDLGDAGKKALKAERDRAAAAEKALRDAQAQLKTFEDAQKTQEQRDAEALAELEKTARESSAKALKYEAAAAAGLPLAAALRLTGESLEELVKDAEELKALGIGGPPAPTPPPSPDPSQGGGGGKKTEHPNLASALSAHYETQ